MTVHQNGKYLNKEVLSVWQLQKIDAGTFEFCFHDGGGGAITSIQRWYPKLPCTKKLGLLQNTLYNGK